MKFSYKAYVIPILNFMLSLIDHYYKNIGTRKEDYK